MTTWPSAPLCLAEEILHFERIPGVPDLAKALGIDRASLERAEATVPITTLYDALEIAAAATGDSHFGVRFATYWAKVVLDGANALHFLLQASPTLRVAWDRILRFQGFWNPAERFELVGEAGSCGVRFRPWGAGREAHVHQAEKLATLAALILRAIGFGSEPLAVTFAHAARGSTEELTRALGVVPTHGATCTEITYPAEVMDRPLPGANPSMFRFMERYLEKALAGCPREEPSFTARGQVAVEDLLDRGSFSRGLLARRLGCGERTLARRLDDEGSSVRDIVDQVQRGRAEALLVVGMPISEVALRLGYSEASAFQHAFRRWHGTSPKAWLDARTGRAAKEKAGGHPRPGSGRDGQCVFAIPREGTDELQVARALPPPPGHSRER